MPKGHRYYVYILSNKKYGTLYIGVTNCLERRGFEHKIRFNIGFSAKYNLDKLVYYEEYLYVNDAIQREKSLKKYSRMKKIELIDKFNSQWNDLYLDLNH
jgi:putative endonuclease